MKKLFKIQIIASLVLYTISGAFSFANANANAQLFQDLKILSSEMMAGRKPGTEGHKRAQSYIIKRLQEANVLSFESSSEHISIPYKQPFSYGGMFKTSQATNLLGFHLGQEFPEQFIVITAHYDHLGKKGSSYYFGADDNASGVSAMLKLADYFSKNSPKHSIIYLATDAEESGLKGAKAFIEQLPLSFRIKNSFKSVQISKSQLALNLNLDMIATPGKRKTLFVSGTREVPIFKSLIKEVGVESRRPGFRLKAGHDTRERYATNGEKGPRNWFKASDHGVFKRNDIRFLYFGVDPHPNYHSIRDTFENIDRAFYDDAVRSIVSVTIKLDDMDFLEAIQ